MLKTNLQPSQGSANRLSSISVTSNCQSRQYTAPQNTKRPSNTNVMDKSKESEDEKLARVRLPRPPICVKRAYSSSPQGLRPRSPTTLRKNTQSDRRCHSLSPLNNPSKKSSMPFAQPIMSAQENLHGERNLMMNDYEKCLNQNEKLLDEIAMPPNDEEIEKEICMPQILVTKMMRNLATKRREFVKLRKNVMNQQNYMLEQFSAFRDMEQKAGVPPEDLGEVKVCSVQGWPAHDLLMLVRDDCKQEDGSEMSGVLGQQVYQQLQGQLLALPEEMHSMYVDLLGRRQEILNQMRTKYRSERSYVSPKMSSKNLEWKVKNQEYDQETEQLNKMVTATVDNLRAKINYCLEIAKIPWMDRDVLIKKMDKIQKDNILLQHKLEEIGLKKERENDKKETNLKETAQSAPTQDVYEELGKERAAREALKEVVSAAESMLRVARARIATLERQLKESRTELDNVRRKHKDLEQLYRHRESSYDARSKRLIEVSKTGEMAIEALSRQRDALELRVKELRDQAEEAERSAALRLAEQRSRAESLQAKVAEQEKSKVVSDCRIAEMEGRVKELEDQLQSLRERSVRLVDMERKRCLEYVPTKEAEPTDRETEIWKELQVTRVALSRAEDELRNSRADKDSFLNSLSKIAQGEGAEKQDKMAAELLEREQRIVKLQHLIEELRENERLMEQSMTDYENQLAALRLEVKRLRSYDCYVKDIPYQDLHTELLELHMQVETLSRERSALVSAAASRALMLERHERAADLFARMTRARRDLAAQIEGRLDAPPLEETIHAEVSRSLSSVCATAADTWSALRTERARVLRLESAVLAQSLHLDREARARTQLERRRAMLEREIIRTQRSSHNLDATDKINSPRLMKLMKDRAPNNQLWKVNVQNRHLRSFLQIRDLIL